MSTPYSGIWIQQNPMCFSWMQGKYAWAGVLTQVYDEVDELTLSSDGTKKIRMVHHPITYVSGLFRGSQLNWAALTKEAYAIYLSVRKP